MRAERGLEVIIVLVGNKTDMNEKRFLIYCLINNTSIGNLTFIKTIVTIGK